MASVVPGKCAQGSAITGVLCPTLLPMRLEVELDWAAHGGKGRFTVVQLPVHICMIRNFGCNVRRAHEV